MYNDENITTTKTLNNLKRSLVNNLKNKYDIENEETIEGFLKIHGLNKESFDFINSVERTMSGILNDESIDGNSNKNEKTISSIYNESLAPVKKVVGFDYLYRKMEELYGSKEAKFLIGEMLDLSLGLSDSTNITVPYCWALDASKIVQDGRPFGQLKSKPAKRVSSYISALCESIHQLTAHLAGAIAIGTFFIDIAHLSLYGEQIDLRELKTNKKYRKKLENEMQQFVHSVNHLSRNGAESPFTNVSLFDRVKLRALVEEMSWYFPLDKMPINHPEGTDPNDETYFEYILDDDNKEFYIEYVIDFIMEIQNIFLDFFDKGDPESDGSPYRFPIATLNLSKKQWGEKEIVEDQKFLKSVCRRDVYRYNIFVSEGTKVASCCRLLSDADMLGLASQSNSFGGSSISLGSHRVCTINFHRIALEAETKEQFYEILDERLKSTAKILKAHKELISDLEQRGLQPFITNGWIQMNRLFSTFGLLGNHEASILFKQKFGNGFDVTADILTYVNDKVLELSAEHGLIGNIEQIPAESFAIRLARADKMLYGEEAVPYKLYANQWIPLWEDATIWEKMDADGKYNKLVTGGGIVHCTIGEKVTAKQAEELIKYSVNSGSEHFALNSIYSKCENNHTNFGKHQTCPTCAGKCVEWYTRVVGFFTPVTSWQDVRREWEFPKRNIQVITEKK